MNDIPPFKGFPKETLTFFAGLTKNNNRAWFAKHKDDYEEHVLKPAQSFVIAMGERLQKISSHIEYDPRTSGSGSIMRIYRDVRFSKDKTPYNTRLRFIFWEGPYKKMANPGFFIGLDATGGGVYTEYDYYPSRPTFKLYVIAQRANNSRNPANDAQRLMWLFTAALFVSPRMRRRILSHHGRSDAKCDAARTVPAPTSRCTHLVAAP